MSALLCILPILALPLLVACGKNASTSSAAPPSSGSAAEIDELEPVKVVFALRGHELDFRRCFFRAPHERGLVKVEFEVDEEGVVRRADLEEATIDHAEVRSCLLERTRALRFGSLRAPAQGRWTFVFQLAEPSSIGEPNDVASPEDEPSVVVESSSRGQLSAGEIEETVHVGYPLFARCYRDALNRRERRGGTIRFRLVVGEEGRLAQVSDAGSRLPDPLAVDCIAEGFYAMQFPAPSGGSVSALYRIELE